MAEVRFKLDSDQLTIACDAMATYLSEEPKGELHSMMHSLVGKLYARLGKRLPERRLEYQLILPVHDALALRRILMAATEWGAPERHLRELRLALGKIDQLTTRYTVVNA